VVVFDDEYQTQTVAKSQVFPTNPPNFNGVPDNTELMHLHDPNLLHNVKYRYLRGEIYTYTSFILIAVNPYKQLPLYGDEQIKKYFGQALGKQPPHVYAIADRAYKSMRGSKKSQSIVVRSDTFPLFSKGPFDLTFPHSFFLSSSFILAASLVLERLRAASMS